MPLTNTGSSGWLLQRFVQVSNNTAGLSSNQCVEFFSIQRCDRDLTVSQ
jgi:hypothetical protein